MATVPITAVYAGQPSKLRPVPRHDAHLFSGGVLIDSSNASDPLASAAPGAAGRAPRRQCRAAGRCTASTTARSSARPIAASASCRDRCRTRLAGAGSWLAWRLHARDARGDRRQPARRLSRTRHGEALERRARVTLRAYARGRHRFHPRCALRRRPRRQALFDYRPEDAQLFVDLLAQGRGDHPGHRPLRQLGSGRRVPAAASPTCR